MRSLTLLLSVLLIAAAAPVRGGLADLENAIGLYTAIPDDLDEAGSLAIYEGDPGAFPVYVVLTNPYNQHTGAPISRIGGFEFRLELPSNVMLLNAALPPQSTNFMSPPNFVVGANVPVYGNAGTLATLTLGEFTGTGGRVRLSPVSGPQSIPGSLAVTDFNDDFSLSAAVPSSGNLDAPVFCIFCRQYDEASTWGGVKTLFR